MVSDDGHRRGQGNFSWRAVWVRAMRASSAWTRRSTAGCHHLRHHRLVAILADSHLDLVGEIDAFDLLQKAVDEMLARLLAFRSRCRHRHLLASFTASTVAVALARASSPPDDFHGVP